MFISWQEFVHRPDNVGRPIMELKQKYLREQYIFEQQFNNYLQQLNPNPSTASGGRIQTSTPSPYPLIRLEYPGDYTSVGSGWYTPLFYASGEIKFDFNVGYLAQGEYLWEIEYESNGKSVNHSLKIGYGGDIGLDTLLVDYAGETAAGTYNASGTFNISENISSVFVSVFWQDPNLSIPLRLNYLTLTQTG